VIFCSTVFYGSRTAGILGYISAYEGTSLTARIGRIKQPVFSHGVSQYLGNHAGFHCDLKIFGIDGKNAVHALEGQTNASENRKRASAQSRTSTYGRNRNPILGSECNDGTYLSGVFGFHD